MTRQALSRASAILIAMALLQPSDPAAADETSLRESIGADGAELPDWLSDFTYQRVLIPAQRQEVVAYSMPMKREHLRSLRERGLPWVVPTPSADADWVVGWSKGWWGPDPAPISPQPIFAYRITDPEASGPKQHVVLVGSNHPREDPACWSLHGMVEFLVSEDPQARELRQHFVFDVYPAVNPDGKLHLEVPPRSPGFRSVNGNPELSAAGESNHNRVWHTTGRFTSIDVTKSAILRDTGGSPDYLLDFHGIPASDFAFVDEAAATSPLGRVFRGRGINLRRSTNPDTHDQRTLRSWASAPEGLAAKAAFTPELTNEPKLEMLERGRRIALAFHDVLAGKPPVFRAPASPDQPDRTPPPPAMAWLLDGQAQAHRGSIHGVAEHTKPAPDEGPFPGSGAKGLLLDDDEAAIRFDAAAELDSYADLSVSLWIRGDGEERSNSRYIASRYLPGGDQRSWALTQQAGSRDIQITISADGTHDRSRIKRYLTTAWPEFQVVDEVWRHVAFTFASEGDGNGDGRLRLFVDGVEITMTLDGHFFDDSPVPRLHPNGSPLSIGALEGSGNAFRGSVSEFAVWDRALSPDEILWLSRNSVTGIAGDPAESASARAKATLPRTLMEDPQAWTADTFTPSGAPVVPMWKAPMPRDDRADGVGGAGYPVLAAAEHVSVWQPGSRDEGAFNHYAALGLHQGRFFAMWGNHPMAEDAPGQRILFAYSDQWGDWSQPVELFPAPGPVLDRPESGIHLKADRWIESDERLYAVVYSIGKEDMGITRVRLSELGL